MKTYRITLSPLSKLENLHHSQNLFGFFCYRLKDRYDEETLETILKALEKGEKTLEISSIMPEKSVFWPSLTIEYSSAEMFDSVIAKQLKKIRYVSFKVLDILLQASFVGDCVVKNIKEDQWVFNKDLLMMKDEIFYEYSLGIDIRYSSKEKTPFNVKSYGIHKNSKFNFYIRTDIEEITTLLKETGHINLGKYKNVALNTYEVLKHEPITFSTKPKNILLSKYIPENEKAFDREHSFVKIDMVKSRLENRMFDSYDSKHADTFSVISEGSIIVTNSKHTGILKKRPTASKIIGKPIFYNGFAFFYPVGDVS